MTHKVTSIDRDTKRNKKRKMYDWDCCHNYSLKLTLVVAIAVCGCLVVVQLSFRYGMMMVSLRGRNDMNRISVSIAVNLSHTPQHNDIIIRHITELDDSMKQNRLVYDYDTPPVTTTTTTSRNATHRLLPDPIVVPFPKQRFIILVMSQRSHSTRRSMIRQTWGRTYAKSLLFVIGGGGKDTESIFSSDDQLMKEQALYHDLLDTIHPESYRSLPHKLRYAIHWVMTNIQELQQQQQHSTSSMLQWILKVDDDMYLRDIHHYTTTATTTSSSSSSSSLVDQTPIVMGCIQSHIPVQRNGKWAEESWFYQRYPIYPPWPKGSCGYMFNHKVAHIITQKYNQDIQSMNQQQQKSGTQRTTSSIRTIQHKNQYRPSLQLPSYQGEDTSLGIWLQHSNISWIDSPYFVNHGNCQVSSQETITTDNNSSIIPWCIGHHMTSEQIQYCYDIEHSILYNTAIPYSPLEYSILPTPNHQGDNDPMKKNDNAAYTEAMMRQDTDQKWLRRQRESEERSKRRHVIQKQFTKR